MPFMSWFIEASVVPPVELPIPQESPVKQRPCLHWMVYVDRHFDLQPKSQD